MATWAESYQSKLSKPKTEFQPGIGMGIRMNPIMMMGGNSFAQKIASSPLNKLPGFGSIFGSNDRPSAKDLLMYHYGKVGALQQKAQGETDPRKIANLNKKIEKNMSATEKYAYKLDKKTRPGAKFLGPRTFAEIDAGRQAYMQRMQAGPSAPTRTILRTL